MKKSMAQKLRIGYKNHPDSLKTKDHYIITIICRRLFQVSDVTISRKICVDIFI